MWFDEVTVSEWCSMLAHERQTFLIFSTFWFCLFIYLIIYLTFCSVLYSINYLSLVYFSYIIISIFYKKNLIKTKYFLLKKHHGLWVPFPNPTTVVKVFSRFLTFYQIFLLPPTEAVVQRCSCRKAKNFTWFLVTKNRIHARF